VELYKKLYTFNAKKQLAKWELPPSRPKKKKLKLPKIKRFRKKKVDQQEDAGKENGEVDIDRVIRKLYETKKR
jgi:hypothetical protein